MNSFIHFREISVENRDSWNSKSIISLDIDWAPDDILDICLDLLEEFHVKACFFITHSTPVLKRINVNPLFEIGIHPNFNHLIDGAPVKKASQILDDLLELAPSCSVLRSHSMTTSGRWINLFKEKGITYLSNYIQYGLDPIVPFKHINGLIETPVYFADDGYAYINETEEIENIPINEITECSRNGIKVYNFHPIHLALNTFKISDYTRYKENGDYLIESSRNNINGSLNLFKQLLCSAQKS
jgi:hypothetical protein